MIIKNTTQNTTISTQACLANTFLSRMIGLLKTPELLPDQALIITKCNSIHMFFMKYSLDVIFVDKTDCVVGIIKNIKPFRLSPIFFKASYVIEAPVGTIDKSRTQLTDKITTNE